MRGAARTGKGGCGIRKIAKILLVFLIVAAIAIGAVLYRQWENVKTIYEAKTNSTETIIRKAEESKEQQRAVLEENGISVVPPSLDQIESLIDGKTTADELKEELGVAEAAPEQAASAAPLTEEQREAKAQERTEGCVKELYAYEADLMESLSALKQEALDAYHALPREEQTRRGRLKVGYSFLDRCYELEAESDARVQEILDKLRDDLEALGRDTSIADTLWQHYCDEKSTAKEYYFSKYL